MPLEAYKEGDMLLVRETTDNTVWVAQVLARDEYLEFLEVWIYGSYNTKASVHQKQWRKAYADVVDDRTVYTNRKPKATWKPWVWTIRAKEVASAPFAALTGKQTVPATVKLLQA